MNLSNNNNTLNNTFSSIWAYEIGSYLLSKIGFLFSAYKSHMLKFNNFLKKYLFISQGGIMV